MNWIAASCIMFVSSVCLYLLVRKSTLYKNSSQYNNLAMFLIPFILFLSIGVALHLNFIISFEQLFIIIIASIFFSYLGNMFSLKSIEYAPNPGYSLVISKSYVVFTTVVAVLFLNAEVTTKSALGILAIVIFSALIMLSKTKENISVNQLWLPLAIGAFFCWGFLSLGSKYLFTQGLHPIVVLTYITFFVSILILLEMKKKKIPITLIRHKPQLFVLIGLLSSSFNLFMMEAIKQAPNIGYVNAINAASISAVTIFAVLLFKDDFSLRKFVGVIGVTAGLILLLI